MERYNYLAKMTEDIFNWIESEMDRAEVLACIKEDACAFEEFLRDELWAVDAVTGNGINGYAVTDWEAEENICHNLDLAAEAFREFGRDGIPDGKGAKYIDITIRCYMLGEAVSAVVDYFKALSHK